MTDTHRNSEGAPEPGAYPYPYGTGAEHTAPVPPLPPQAPTAHEAPYTYSADYGSGFGSGSSGGPAHHAAGTGGTVPPTGYGDTAGPDGDAPKRRRLRRPVTLVAAVALISALTGGVAGGVISADRSQTGGNYSTAAVVTADSKGTSTVAAIAAAVSPSVVQITVNSGNSEDIGTGIVLTSSGQILTNYHVISSAVSDSSATIKISFSDGRTTTASVLATDAATDVAVIKAANESGLKTASLGDSSQVTIGDAVVAIGNPDGLTGTVTSGIVSALNRKVTVDVSQSTVQGNGGYGFPSWPGQGSSGRGSSSGAQTATYNAIQTDAALNPGNSGGPLLNSSGQVIGINASMYSSSSSSGSGSQAGSVGLGFAIPINAVKAVLAKLQAGQSISS
jgi:putative serine protease PepD